MKSTIPSRKFPGFVEEDLKSSISNRQHQNRCEGITGGNFEILGTNYFDFKRECLIGPENLIIFDDGYKVAISSQDKPVRFLSISGNPIGEPVSWYGPIVMTTKEELRIASEEYQNGTFVKHRK